MKVCKKLVKHGPSKNAISAPTKNSFSFPKVLNVSQSSSYFLFHLSNYSSSSSASLLLPLILWKNIFDCLEYAKYCIPVQCVQNNDIISSRLHIVHGRHGNPVNCYKSINNNLKKCSIVCHTRRSTTEDKGDYCCAPVHFSVISRDIH